MLFEDIDKVKVEYVKQKFENYSSNTVVFACYVYFEFSIHRDLMNCWHQTRCAIYVILFAFMSFGIMPLLIPC